ncbi:discoidin domain-containing protein [Dactylosporangium sp. NPDC050688]|uniref:discoidin domain-containing protein n=1 Tax=Dactylosporangium sp. NPDC050688 TaxID=3157217 RepID=UPI0033D04EC0
MTSPASLGPTRRVDRCLLAGDVPALPVVPDGWLAVLVAPDLEVTAAELAGPVRAAVGDDDVLLLAPGPLGSQLALLLDRPVVAPDGPVIQTPGGILVTADVAGGWWRHRPGSPAEPLGPRWPAPDWQVLVPATTPWPDTVIAQPVPAGWLLSPGPIGAAAAFDGVEFAVAVDPARPRLLLDPALTGEQLAQAMAALPTRVRRVADLVPLGAGQGAGRPLAAAAAIRLDEPVHLVNGVPLHPPAGPITVFALDAHRRPVWAEPTWLLRFTPDGDEEVVASSPPHASLRSIDPATYAMDMGWQVRLGGGGIHAFPGPPPPPAKGRASLPVDPPSGGDRPPSSDGDRPPSSDGGRTLSFVVSVPAAAGDGAALPAPGGDGAASPVPGGDGAALPAPGGRNGGYRVVVGTAGEVIDDLVWPPLSAMFTALLSEIPASVDLVVLGKSSAWGEAAERELAERHPGSGVTSGQARDFQRCDLLPMPPVPAPPDPPAVVRHARNGLALLAAAAVVVLLLAVAGAVAFWPRDGNGTDLDARGEPQTATMPGTPAPSAAASVRASGSTSPKPSASASPRPSTSAQSSPSPGAPSTVPSTPPLPLDTGADVALGRPTSESSHIQVYSSGRVTDGDPMSYWESRNNALPQWVQVDLGTPVPVRRVVLRLPQSAAWPARTQTVTILSSIDGASFATISGASCRFDAANGQRATLGVAAGQHRYIRVVITSNSVLPAGQLSSVEIYRS